MLLDNFAFPVTITTLIFALVVTIVGSVVLWLTGLLVAVIFFAAGVALLYLFKDVLDIDQNKWLMIVPFGMLFLGFGLDKIGILSLAHGFDSTMEMQGFSVVGVDGVFPIGFVVLAVLVCLLVAVVVRRR